jgi:hypothetical protein
MPDLPEFKEQDREALRAWVRGDFAIPNLVATGGSGDRLILALMRMRSQLEALHKQIKEEVALVNKLRAKGYRIIDAEGKDV